MSATIIGPRLAEARKSRGWTLREAEQRTGVPNAHICQIETGTIKRPEPATLIPLARAYGIPLAELMAAAGHDTSNAVTEYGLLLSSGGYQIRNTAPEIEKWIRNETRRGHVYRRRVIVVEDWEEVDAPSGARCHPGSASAPVPVER